MTDFMGKDFIWWVGVVEDRHDPLYLGRCKVRCLGWHTKDKDRMPTASLPWATPLQPVTSAAQTQVGHTPLGLVEGSWVLGFFQDGGEAQYPIIMGSLGGYPSIKNDPYVGFNDPRPAIENPFWNYDETDNKPKLNEQRDQVWPTPPYSVELNVKNDSGQVSFGPTITEYGDEGATERPAYPRLKNLGEPTTSRLARGVDDKSALILTDEDRQGTSIVQWKEDHRVVAVKKARPVRRVGPLNEPVEDPNWFEPNPAYNAQYPYNHVYESESGHVTEIDDTPQAERLHWFHRAGTFTEIYPDGRKVNKVTNNCYDIVYGHNHELVKRSKYVNVDNSYQLYVNHSDSSTGDYYLKVGAGGSIFNNVVRGNIENNATGGDISFNSANFNVTTNDDINLTAKSINLTYQNFTKTVTGSETQTIEGSTELAADTISMAGDKEVQLTSKSVSTTAAISSVEQLRSVPTTGTVNLTEPNAKTISANFGKIVLNTKNNAPIGATLLDDGGIELQHGLLGLGANIKLDDVGDIGINSIAGLKGVSVFSGVGSTSFETLIGDETHTLAKGAFDVTAALGDIKLTAVVGGINIESQTGNINVKTTTETNIEGTAAANLIGAAIVLDGKTINLVKGSSEPVILGSKFVKEFVKHQHATGTGPSGPVTDSSPYTNHLSKKVFSG